MNHPPELVDRVLTDYRTHRSPYKTATALGLQPRLVWEIIDASADKLATRQEVYGGFGRESLRKFTVSRSKVSDGWDNSEPSIAAARAAYEAGTVELMTGRDGNWLILYAFPRDNRARHRAGYFKLEG